VTTELETLVKHLGAKLASDLIELGTDRGSKAHRVQYMGYNEHDEEIGQGGMCEAALASFFTRKLGEYFDA
jgi:hypothetical protein